MDVGLLGRVQMEGLRARVGKESEGDDVEGGLTG